MSLPSGLLFNQDQSVAAICRLCFMEQTPAELEFIFGDGSGYLSEWIEKLTSLKITNVSNAPTSLCSSCKSTLEAFDSFREMCITNDLVFKETFCQDTTRWKELADGIEVESDEDRQTENDSEQNVNSLIQSEISPEQEENDVSVIELLVDVYDSDMSYEADVDQEINQEDNLDGTLEASIEGTIQTEYEEIHGNISSDVHTTEIDITHRAVKAVVSDTRQYQCKICNSNVSKLHILTHKEVHLFECYICSGRVQRYKYMSKHFYRWHKTDSAEPGSVENVFKTIDCQTNSERNCQAQLVDVSVDSNVPPSTTENSESLVHSPSITHICKICMQVTSKFHAMSHKAVGMFLCHVCNKTFDKIGLLTMHAKSHSKNQKCPVYQNTSNEIIDLCDDQPEETPVSAESDVEVQIVGHAIPTGPSVRKDDYSEEYNRNLVRRNGKHFLCKICNNFVSELHQVTHKAKDFFTCICLQTFPSFAFLSKHVQSRSHKSNRLEGCNALR